MSPDGEIAGPQTHHTFSRRELVNRNLGTRLLPTGTKPVPRSFIAYSKKEEDAHEIIPCYLGERRHNKYAGLGSTKPNGKRSPRLTSNNNSADA